MRSLWQIEELKNNKDIFAMSKDNIKRIGDIIFGTNCDYYKEDFRGTIFRGKFDENILEYFLSSKKGFFIRKFNNDKDYIYIDKKGHVFRVNDGKIKNQIFSEEINKIINNYL